jgi:hypothetical protein
MKQPPSQPNPPLQKGKHTREKESNKPAFENREAA